MGKARIKVRPELKEELEKLKGEKTWTELLEELKESGEWLSAYSVIDIPDNVELQEELIQAIKEARPPPEWRQLLVFALMGLFAGIGLGLYLALG